MTSIWSADSTAENWANRTCSSFRKTLCHGKGSGSTKSSGNLSAIPATDFPDLRNNKLASFLATTSNQARRVADGTEAPRYHNFSKTKLKQSSTSETLVKRTPSARRTNSRFLDTHSENSSSSNHPYVPDPPSGRNNCSPDGSPNAPASQLPSVVVFSRE
jgi:hypothetical protein